MAAEHVTGDVVQARDVTGGIHFHAEPPTPPVFSVTPRQLPGDVRAFVNREREITELGVTTGIGHGGTTPRDDPPDGAAAVVVLTGSAGVGKTALALHWAHRIRHLFADGEIYLNLRGYDPGPPLTPEAALDRVLRDLGVPAQSIPDGLDDRAALYRSLLAVRRVLVVLDNAATVGQVRPLLPGAPGSLVVVTSRNRLPGLVVRDGARRIQLDIFAEPDSLTLLHAVITDRRDDDPADLTELARLCSLLPLALRIAAERAASQPMMRLAELIADLRDDSFLWDALSTDDGAEADAVRTVFAWSYRALPDDAATMFRMLGLHPGNDISLPAAAAAAGVGLRPARRALDILLGAFLIENIRPGRYQFHDLLRAYARDQSRHLDTDQERAAAVDRVTAWYLHTVDAATALIAPNQRLPLDEAPPGGVEPLSFRDPADALHWFESERANLVAATRSALDAGLPHRAWQLAMAISPIHMHHHTFDDWTTTAEIAVTAAEATGDRAALATALDNRGKVLSRRHHLDTARSSHAAALALRRELGDLPAVGRSLNALGLIDLPARDLAAAAERFAEAAEIFDQVGDRLWQGLARSNLTQAQLEAGDADAAHAALPGTLALFVDVGEPAYEGNTLWLISRTQRARGDLAAAQTAIGRALAIAETAENRVWEAHWLIEAAHVHLAGGNPAEALECCRTSAALHRKIGDRSREATALDCAGQAIRALGRPDEATAFHRQAIRAHHDLGDTWQEATAHIHLADCLHDLAHTNDEHHHLSTALRLLETFTDLQAQKVAADITARTSPPPAQL